LVGMFNTAIVLRTVGMTSSFLLSSRGAGFLTPQQTHRGERLGFSKKVTAALRFLPGAGIAAKSASVNDVEAGSG
jgi:hypothetical protein